MGYGLYLFGFAVFFLGLTRAALDLGDCAEKKIPLRQHFRARWRWVVLCILPGLAMMLAGAILLLYQK